MPLPNSILLKNAINQLIAGQSLSESDMQDAVLDLMQGNANESQIAAFLVALRIKGETVPEITGAVKAMRSLMLPVVLDSQLPVVDIVGTGGDGANLLNISTAATMVCAAAGLAVAKHGNRSVSSKSGSADLLEAAGIQLNLNSQQVAQCVNTIGVGFMFALQHHPAMRYAAPVRKALGIRTIFNLLGPLTNPAGVKHQVIGVYDRQWARPVVEVLQSLGSVHVLAVHSNDGLDELSLGAPSYVVELKNGIITEYELTPEDVGLVTTDLTPLKVDNAQQSLALLKNAFSKKRDAAGELAANMIAYNAGAALYVGGITTSIKNGVDLAQDVIWGGQALEKLNGLAHFTQTLVDTH